MAPRAAWLLLLALPALVLPAPAPLPHDAAEEASAGVGGAASAAAALALLAALAAVLLGCSWCHRYKNCKLFGAGARRASVRAAEEARAAAAPAPVVGAEQAPGGGDAERGPVYLVRAPDNNNTPEDNNNGPISLRELQNIENNNAAVYIVSENENRNAAAAGVAGAVGAVRAHASRDSVVEFEPLPANITPSHGPHATAAGLYPAGWFEPPYEEFPRNRLQYLREIGRGSFGRVVEGEVEAGAGARAVAVRILEQDGSPAARARFLRDADVFRRARHHNVLSLLARNLSEDPWLLIFDLCDTDLPQYLSDSRERAAELTERGVPLRLQCDIAAGLAHLHSLRLLYSSLWSGGVLVSGGGGDGDEVRARLGHYGDVRERRLPPWTAPEMSLWSGGVLVSGGGGDGDEVRARLGHYGDVRERRLPPWTAPEILAQPSLPESCSSEIWSLGVVLWEVCAWGEPPPASAAPPPPPPQSCLYRDHLYQVMQLCCSVEAERRPSAAQVQALLEHLRASHVAGRRPSATGPASDFEDRWQRLKPNSIPKVDEHPSAAAVPAAPASDLLAVEPRPSASRSSSVVSETLHIPSKSDSLTNLHGSFEDVRDAIYTGLSNGTCFESQLESTGDNKTLRLEEGGRRECENRTAGAVDPWLKDMSVQGEDASFYRDVSDVIQSLDNILNSEKTSSSESSHQASPSRDRLALQLRAECLALAPSSLVKSPGIADFQSFLQVLPETRTEVRDEPVDHEPAALLSHSFERTSEDASPDQSNFENNHRDVTTENDLETKRTLGEETDSSVERGDSESVPSLRDLCVARANVSINSTVKYKLVSETKDCQESCDNDNLFKTLEICADIKSDGVINISNHFVKVEDIVGELHSERDVDMPPGDIIPATVATTESEIKLDESEELDKNMQLEIYNPPQDRSDVTEEEIYKSSISDTEVLSMDNDSTVYMDLQPTLTESVNNEISTNPLNRGVEKDITKLCSGLSKEEIDLEISRDESNQANDSTHYLDLPQVIKETSSFLHAERTFSAADNNYKDNKTSPMQSPPCTLDVIENNILITSTPKISAVTCDNEHSDVCQEEECCDVQQGVDSRRDEIPNYGPGVTLTKLEQQAVPEHLSASACIDTSEDTGESSVDLGPFENHTLDYFSGIKTETKDTNSLESDLPKEELLAFSSNFVELSLDSENVSSVVESSDDRYPRDVHPDFQAHAQESIRINLSPTTPPNSPGNLLSSSPQRSYVLQDNVASGVPDPPRLEPDVVDMSHMEIQLTSKLAMAENENNLNMEYSGPLSVEEPPPPDAVEAEPMEAATPPECDVAPESGYRGGYDLDDECVRALRSELQLKLPLAQASSCELLEECPPELPPPPPGVGLDAEGEGEGEGEAARGQLVLCYPAALSPILEETDPQLSAYHNNLTWNTSHRTDSSESYPEPCNNSTDEITDLVTAMRSVQKDYDTLNNCENDCLQLPDSTTFTVHKAEEISDETTMSADSLNETDDGTLKDVELSNTEKVQNPIIAEPHNAIKSPVMECEHISQESPYLLSPTMESSKNHTDSNENASNVSKVSKPTLPTGKSSKNSDTQCLSKATSIDSWCSNDTLFNVEDNFEELVLESEPEGRYEDGSRNSETHTLEDDSDSKDSATYIVHESKSDNCESVTTDSIAANCTYTKGTAPQIEYFEKNSSEPYTKVPYPEIINGNKENGADSQANINEEEVGYFESVEQIRRSPLVHEVEVTPPVFIDTLFKVDDNDLQNQNRVVPVMDKMDSVEINCSKEDLIEVVDQEAGIKAKKSIVYSEKIVPLNNAVEQPLSPERHYKGMANSVTSTPLVTELNLDESALQKSQSTAFKTPPPIYENIPDFCTFVNSAELRPQDMSPYMTTCNGALPPESANKCSLSPSFNSSKEDSKTVTFNSHSTQNNPKMSNELEDKSSGYSEFQSSIKTKSQDLASFGNDTDKSGIHSLTDCIISSQEFLQFEISAQTRPQDLLLPGGTISSVDVEPLSIGLLDNCESPNKADSCKDEPLNMVPNIEIVAFSSSHEEELLLQSEGGIHLQNNTKTSDGLLNGPESKVDLLPSFINDSTRNETTPSLHLQNESTEYTSHIIRDNRITVTQPSGDVHTYMPIQSMKSGIEFNNENCPNFSSFEISAQIKPQELSSFTNKNCSDYANVSNNGATSKSAEFSSFERSAVGKPQDLSSVIKTAQDNSQSSHNFNETFETYDSHKAQRNPENIVQSVHSWDEDFSEEPRHNNDSHYESKQAIHESKENSEDAQFQSDNIGNNTQVCDSDCMVEQRYHTNQFSEEQPNENIVEITDPGSCKEDEAESDNVNEIAFSDSKHMSPIKSIHNQDQLSFQDSIENKNDSLVSLTEEILPSDATNIDKEISSTASTTEESEPTTKEIDSLENNVEKIDQFIVHNDLINIGKVSETICDKNKSQFSKLQNGGDHGVDSIDDVENDHDLQIVQAIEELDQVLDANGVDIDDDLLSDSPSPSPSDIVEQRNAEVLDHSSNALEIRLVTNNFIEHEKINSYLPLLSDIRFTGPSSDYMSTSFTEDSPSEEASLLVLEWELQRAEQNAERLSSAAAGPRDWDSGAAAGPRDWESGSDDSHTTSSSSGEFIWKDGEGQERCLTITTDFDDREQNGGGGGGGSELGSIAEGSEGEGGEAGSEGSGSEGDEVEFVPSSWDCRAAPGKSSLKSLEPSSLHDGKKRVLFKRQKYHCVYEYPREAADDCDSLHSPFLPDYSTYAVWEALGGSGGGAGEAALGYSYAGGAPLHLYHLPGDANFSPNYGMPDEDFFISSSARPFESLGIMSTTSQFFPGLHATLKAVNSPERGLSPAGEISDEFPPPPSPLTPLTKPTTLASLDFTTPDSGVEDVTPGCTLDEPPAPAQARTRLELRAPESSASSSESASPSSPGGEALGGLRHTRDRLKLDLPPSPSPLHLTPSASRHTQRVFNFLASPAAAAAPASPAAPHAPPEPTFSTFGKGRAATASAEPATAELTSVEPAATESATESAATESATESVTAEPGSAQPPSAEPPSAEPASAEMDEPEVAGRARSLLETVRGEGTVLDSGDEDSGIESSAKTTLERKPPHHSSLAAPAAPAATPPQE